MVLGQLLRAPYFMQRCACMPCCCQPKGCEGELRAGISRPSAFDGAGESTFMPTRLLCVPLHMQFQASLGAFEACQAAEVFDAWLGWKLRGTKCLLACANAHFMGRMSTLFCLPDLFPSQPCPWFSAATACLRGSSPGKLRHLQLCCSCHAIGTLLQDACLGPRTCIILCFRLMTSNGAN